MGEFHNGRAKADKHLNVISVPHQIFGDISTAKKVGKGNLCRIEGTAGGFVHFGKTDAVGVPSGSTKETIQTELGFFYVIATEDYIRSSAAMRVEITQD